MERTQTLGHPPHREEPTGREAAATETALYERSAAALHVPPQAGVARARD